MRAGVVVVTSLLVVSGCSSPSVFACGDDADCSRGGQPGVCEDAGYCSFDDEACPSGRRFGTFAGMGLAGACVAEDEQASTGDAGTGSTTGVTTLEPSSGTTTEMSAGPMTTSETADDTSTSGPDDPTDPTDDSTPTTASCETYDFEEFPDFEDLGVFTDVILDAGLLTISWSGGEGSSANFGVRRGTDLRGGSTTLDVAQFPASTGTLVALQWEDAQGRIIYALYDGPNFVISYDEGDPLVTPAHQDRNLLRIAGEPGMIVVEAGGPDGFDELVTIGEPFDLASADVRLFFNRYENDGMSAQISIDALTVCDATN